MQNQYTVSVIIPVHNCATNLEETLTILSQQDYKGEIEIIVVDNNSKDSSDQIAKKFSNVILTYQTDIQSAAATRNKGIALAKGDIIAFIDGDCIPEPDWLRQGIQCMENTGSDRVGGKIIIRPLFPYSSIYSLIEALFCYNQECAIKEVGACMTPNLIIKRQVFDRIGLFNQDYFEMEDMEFGLRAAKVNISVAYAENCIVWHPPRVTFAEMWKKSRRNGKGTFILCQNNPKWAGNFGWKHPLRCIKIILTPRSPYWKILSFDPKLIPWLKKIKIYLFAWIIINIGEAYGYFEAWIKFIIQNKFS